MAPLDKARPSNLLHRRNSIATPVVVPFANLRLPIVPQYNASPSSPPSSSFAVVDFELVSIRPQSYTSLKDLLPSTAVLSPRPTPSSAGNSAYEISIRNRLVKQAAWAYLQPMSASTDSSGRHFLRRLSAKLSGSLSLTNYRIASFFGFIGHSLFGALTRTFDRLLRIIRVRSFRH